MIFILQLNLKFPIKQYVLFFNAENHASFKMNNSFDINQFR